MREGGDPVVAVCDDRDNVHTKLLENQRPRTAQEHGVETSSKQTQPFIHLRGTIGKLERLRGPEGEREEGKGGGGKDERDKEGENSHTRHTNKQTNRQKQI